MKNTCVHLQINIDLFSDDLIFFSFALQFQFNGLLTSTNLLNCVCVVCDNISSYNKLL